MPCGKAELITCEPKQQQQCDDSIRNGVVFGFVQCSMEVHRDYINKYLEHPPFYITQEINGKRKLSSYMDCDEVLISTDLYNWYRKQPGITLKSISCIIKYNRGRPFKTFVDLGANMRRNKSNKIAGTVWKLLLNAAFGKMGQDNSKYKSTTITNSPEKANRRIYRATFSDGYEYNCDSLETVYEINCRKKIINQNMPIHGAATVFSNAKLRML